MEKNTQSTDELSLSESAASADTSQDLALLLQQSVYSEFSGPLPHPEILAKYENVFPGAAERIFQMAKQIIEGAWRKIAYIFQHVIHF